MISRPAPQSICILRLSAIGDVCNAVAAVQAIQRHYPDAKLTWVIGRVEHSLLKGLPGVRFVVFDKKQGWHAYKQLKQDLAGENFDYLLHMQVALRANIASLMINARVKVGFDKARAKELHSLFMNASIAPRDGDHVLDGFMQFAAFLGVPKAAPVWQIPLAADDQAWALAQIGTASRNFIICPAASKAERNWLAPRYAAIGDWMTDKGYQVFICGANTLLEQQLAADIEQHAQHPLVNLVGKSNLKQLLALIAQADLVLAPDTGPAHMANAVGTPVVGLYAHSNPARTGPYRYRDSVVSVYQQAIVEQTGKPLGSQKWGARAKGDDLMARIEVEQVKHTILTLLDKGA
ncbi:glycosyltransferase family 9 protein [Thiomicrospira microaerophila]|uniref:glycosyltransferase family 9 protein n=1 Tax=Thiomicrospira microaerophila TaxID=406020 RepID=UPI00200D2E41|nr:glycosyltransferase family 9 protein [Thiomicrospira microaerophila]UQB42429.1 glycosyltransferase family 9 protein [Thiomicrospira microaerophila]